MGQTTHNENNISVLWPLMAPRDGYKRELAGQVVYPEGLSLYIYPKHTKKAFYHRKCQKQNFFSPSFQTLPRQKEKVGQFLLNRQK